MAVHAQVEGVGTLEFPDGTDPSVIQKTVKEQIVKNKPISTGEKILNVAEPFVEAFGAAGGAALGTVAEPVGGTIVGAGLGYAGGRQLIRSARQVMGYDKPQTAPQVFAEQAKDVVTGAGMEAGGAVAGRVLGPIVKAVGEKVIPKGMPLTDAAKLARSKDYVLKPSEAGGAGGKILEGVAGSPKLSIEATVKNQAKTNDWAALEIGLPKGTKLTPRTITKAKAPHNAVYQEVGNLGNVTTDEKYVADISSIGRTPGKSFSKVSNPDIETLRSQYMEKGFDAKDAVLQIKILRRNASKNLKNQDPAKNELGYAQKQVSDAIESQLERHAESIGKPDLVQRFRDARKSLAKINTVEDALNRATGDVSAPKLSSLRKKGVPLSGHLQDIADIHDAFPSEMREASKVRNKTPVTVLEGIAGGAGGAFGIEHPLIGGLAASGVIARPLARKYLLSEAYQKSISPGSKALTLKGTEP